MNPSLFHLLAADMPIAIQPSVNYRQAGTSPLYSMHDYWTFNLYEMPGEIELPTLNQRLALKTGTLCFMPLA